MEKAFLALVKPAGLPKPLVNTKVEGIEVDFHWPDRKRIVEIDGPRHRPPDLKARRTRNETRRCSAAGWTVLRSARTRSSSTPNA